MHQRRNNAFETVAENWNSRDSGKTTENPQRRIATPPKKPVSGPSLGREGHRCFHRLRCFSVNGTKSYHSFSLRLQFPVFAVAQTLSFAFYRKGQDLYEPAASARTFSNIDFQSNFSIRVNLFSNKLDLSESATHDPNVLHSTLELAVWTWWLEISDVEKCFWNVILSVTWSCRMQKGFNCTRTTVYSTIKLCCQLSQNVVISRLIQSLALFFKLVQLIS